MSDSNVNSKWMISEIINELGKRDQNNKVIKATRNRDSGFSDLLTDDMYKKFNAFMSEIENMNENNDDDLKRIYMQYKEQIPLFYRWRVILKE